MDFCFVFNNSVDNVLHFFVDSELFSLFLFYIAFSTVAYAEFRSSP